MIIRRFRSLAGLMLLSALACGVSLTAVAQAVKVDYVATGEMHRFVVTTFLAGAGVILGGLAIVYGMLDKSKSNELKTLIKANADQVASLATMFEKHHLDQDAHPAGSKARIDPINAKLDILTEKLTTLCAQHELIQNTEGDVCETLAQIRKAASLVTQWDGAERRRKP